MLIDFIKAFVVGGLICVVGQIFIDKTNFTPARIMVGYVVSGVVLSGIGVYQYLVDFAGAGASVPLIGFGHILAKGVKEGIERDGFLGIIGGGLSASAVGVSVAIILSFIASLLSKRKQELS